MKRTAALLFLLLFALDAATACRTVGTRDAGVLTEAMTGWGVPFWPGFPLLTLIGNLVSHLLHAGEPAFPLNLMNAAFSALACAVLAVAVSVWSGRLAAGLIAGLALGTSRVFWSDALALEVFSFNALMAALLLLLAATYLRALERGEPVLWPLPLAALVMSTCVTHQPTLALVAIPVLIVLVGSIPALRRHGVPAAAIERAAGWSLLAGLAGLLPLVYVPLAARHDPAVNWMNVRTPAGLPALLLRSEYSTSWLMSPSQVVRQILENGEDASPLGPRHLGLYAAGLPERFGLLFPLLALLGLVALARRGRALLALVLLSFALAVAFFARVNTPMLPLWIGVTERFYILPDVVVAFVGGIGIAAALEFAAVRHRFGSLALAIVLAALIVPPNLLRAGTISQRDDTFTRDFGANFLAGVPPRAIVFVEGDLVSQSLHYQRECLGRRRDISIVDQPLMGAPWYVDQLRRRGTLRLPRGMERYRADSATGSRAWLDLNAGPTAGPAARPVVAVRFLDDTWSAAWHMRAMGLWSLIEPKRERLGWGAWAKEYADAVRGWELRSLDRPYPGTSWEAHDSRFYTYALANLRALLEIAARLDLRTPPMAPVPALEMAERWQGRRRAEYLAYQSAFWANELLTAEMLPRGADSLLATRALELAGASLALDSMRVEALQTAVALMSAVPAFRNPPGEALLRERIVRQRPGDLNELVPYLRLVGSLASDPATRDPAMVARAEAARQRYVRLLDLCLRLWPDPGLARLREQWAAGGGATP